MCCCGEQPWAYGKRLVEVAKAENTHFLDVLVHFTTHMVCCKHTESINLVLLDHPTHPVHVLMAHIGILMVEVLQASRDIKKGSAPAYKQKVHASWPNSTTEILSLSNLVSLWVGIWVKEMQGMNCKQLMLLVPVTHKSTHFECARKLAFFKAFIQAPRPTKI
jgi:hypothetical protein